MLQVAYLGLAWGLAIWVLWTGYFLVYSPAWFRRYILAAKYRVIMVDLVITYLGSNIIMSTSGSMVAGIGSGVLMLMCFITSALAIGVLKVRDISTATITKMQYKRGGHRV